MSSQKGESSKGLPAAIKDARSNTPATYPSGKSFIGESQAMIIAGVVSCSVARLRAKARSIWIEKALVEKRGTHARADDFHVVASQGGASHRGALMRFDFEGARSRGG